jgi:hypothetical protein
MGFSTDGAFVTFWAREPGGPNVGEINIWAVPTLGGQPRPYLEGAAEFDWSGDGSRLVYTPRPRRPDVRQESRAADRGSPDLRRPVRTSRAFPPLVAGRQVDLLRPGLRARSDGHLAREPHGGGCRAHHASRVARQPPRPVGSADHDVSRQRSGWLWTLALQHGPRAADSTSREHRNRQVHLAERRRRSSRCHPGQPKITLWRLPVRHAGRVGRGQCTR